MDKLDSLVTGQLIDRLLAPPRLREMLAGLLERREARLAEVDARARALEANATEADERLRRLYKLVGGWPDRTR
jgi:site-specific DNA recombinase